MSKQRKLELSRRKVLAGLGTIGVASAGAGFGTTAYFSDTEAFENNTLTAGELDLKVDWSEHYYDGSPDVSEGSYGFPSTAPEEEQVVYVDDVHEFMDETAIEAFPDEIAENPDEIEEKDYDGIQEFVDDEICDWPADLTGGEDGVLSHPFRTGANVDGGVTIGDGPNPQTTAAGDPLVNISDVKPGDFGEVTFSFHVCGNPGYVWLTGDLVDASENGLTEPEMESDDEDQTLDNGSLDPVDGTVELLDAIHAAIWFDAGEDGKYGAEEGDKDDGEGDNVFGSGEFVALQGSLRTVLKALEGEMFPLDPAPVSKGSNGTSSGDSSDSVGSLSYADYERYVTTEADEFTESDIPGAGTARNYDCSHYEQIFGIDLLGSSVKEDDLDDEPTFHGCTDFTVDSLGDDGDITLSTMGPVRIVSVKGGSKGENVYLFDEPVVLNGVTFSTPDDSDISNIDVCCEVDGENGVPPTEINSQECFQNSTTGYIGFEWWVPTYVGNEIQTDSVSFDLGFYTEQCRHNDNAPSMVNESEME